MMCSGWRCAGVLMAVCMAAGAMALAHAGDQPDKKQDKGAAPKLDAKQEAEMKAWLAAAEPGPHQKFLQQFVGDWKATTKMWQGPGTQPEVSEARMTGTMILGGRHLIQEFHGTLMGMPFEGRGTMSYDNITKKYQSTWMDTMTTGMSYSTGSGDAAGKVFTFLGEMTEPSGKVSKTREVLTVTDANSHSMVFYVVGEDGKEWKNMEIVYARAGAAPASGDAHGGKAK